MTTTDQPTYQRSETERAALRVVRRTVRALRDAGFSPLEADCGPDGDWAPVRTEREVLAALLAVDGLVSVAFIGDGRRHTVSLALSNGADVVCDWTMDPHFGAVLDRITASGDCGDRIGDMARAALAPVWCGCTRANAFAHSPARGYLCPHGEAV